MSHLKRGPGMFNKRGRLLSTFFFFQSGTIKMSIIDILRFRQRPPFIRFLCLSTNFFLFFSFGKGDRIERFFNLVCLDIFKISWKEKNLKNGLHTIESSNRFTWHGITRFGKRWSAVKYSNVLTYVGTTYLDTR